MSNSIFDSTTVPALEQVMNFASRRHDLLAGNIANFDTPGYQARDLSVDEFDTKLKEALDEKRAGGLAADDGSLPDADFSEVHNTMDTIMFHDQSNVSMEHQVTEMAKNKHRYTTALTIMVNQFKLLQAAISERA